MHQFALRGVPSRDDQALIPSSPRNLSNLATPAVSNLGRSQMPGLGVQVRQSRIHLIVALLGDGDCFFVDDRS